jgi:hypothetical protein
MESSLAKWNLLHAATSMVRQRKSGKEGEAQTLTTQGTSREAVLSVGKPNTALAEGVKSFV